MTSASTSTVADDPELLAVLERYYDTVPRANADVSDVGPFTLFVSRGGYPFYARPRLGLPTDHAITAADVAEIRARQSELGVPQAIEWVHETTPSLLAAARATGLIALECPLLVLDREPTTASVAPGAGQVRILGPHDPDLALVEASVHVGFSAPGTETGAESVAERDAFAQDNPDLAERLAARIEGELTVAAGAFDPDDAIGPVGGGQHNPREWVTEIVGVAVLPSHRRRGLGAALSARLARQALDTGVTTVFCSAADDAVARVYEGVGFRRVGTACIASDE